MKVLVTGGAGFIGSNLSERLLEEGHEVVALDDLSTGKADNIAGLMDRDNFHLVNGSILDADLLGRSMEGVDCVFHQAALPSVQRSMERPLLSNEVNAVGTLQVLISARDQGVGKVVFASSSSVYGNTPTLPKREDMPARPRSPYAVTKLMGEHYCRVFSEAYGLRTVCLRYFNVYGPHQDPASAYAAVVPRFISAALSGLPPIIQGDGVQTRDLTFVEDVVRANILAMKSEAQGVFNIASGRRVSINDLAQMVIDQCGAVVAPQHTSPRAGDVRDSLADIALAREELGYAPRYTLEEGLEVTREWFSSRS